jgi:hypothetical protein
VFVPFCEVDVLPSPKFHELVPPPGVDVLVNVTAVPAQPVVGPVNAACTVLEDMVTVVVYVLAHPAALVATNVTVNVPVAA